MIPLWHFSIFHHISLLNSSERTLDNWKTSMKVWSPLRPQLVTFRSRLKQMVVNTLLDLFAANSFQWQLHMVSWTIAHRARPFHMWLWTLHHHSQLVSIYSIFMLHSHKVLGDWLFIYCMISKTNYFWNHTMLHCWLKMIGWTGWTELWRSGGRKWDMTDIASKTCYSNVQDLYNYKPCRGTHETSLWTKSVGVISHHYKSH